KRRMDFSSATLERLYREPPFGDFWPYQGGSREYVKAYLRETITEMERAENVALLANFSDYAGGYQSHVDIFCWPRDGSSQRRETIYDVTEGIVYYLSGVAPVMTFSPDVQRLRRFGRGGRYEDGGHTLLLSGENPKRIPAPEWEPFHRSI